MVSTKKHTKKKGRKSYKKRGYRKKKGGIGTPHSASAHVKTLWGSLKPYEKRLCFAQPSTKNHIQTCYNYMDSSEKSNSINVEYELDDVKTDDFPILIFETDGQNNYDMLPDGISNFILFYDNQNDKYILVTAYYDGGEYGSKHDMILYRLKKKLQAEEGIDDDELPEKYKTFIISGEIKKERNMVLFHDYSSQYFRANSCRNLKNLINRIVIFDMMESYGLTPETIDLKENEKKLNKIKEEILKLNPGTQTTLAELKKLNFEDLIQKMRKPPTSESPLNRIYRDKITSYMSDAFSNIFKSDKINTSYTEDLFNADIQKNMNKFIDDMCRKNPQIEFDIYNGSNCVKGKYIKKSCSPATPRSTASVSASAAPASNFTKLTVAELRDRLTTLGTPFRSNLKKADLISLLSSSVN
jgi:hypothetical protein